MFTYLLSLLIVLAAVDGLSGLFRAVSAVEPSLFRSSPPTPTPVPVPNKLCESRGDRPELSVLTSLLVSVDVKND